MDENKSSLELNSFFNTKLLSDFPAPKNGVLTLRSDSTIHEAFAQLFEHNFQAAPVENVAAAKDASWVDKYPDIIDMLDIVTFACGLAEKQKHEGDFNSFLHKTTALQSLPLSGLTEKKFGSGFNPISEESTFLDAVIFLGKYRVRRLIVIPKNPEESELKNIVTQSAMCRYLAEALKDPKFSEKMSSQTVEQIGLNKPREIYYVDFRAHVIDAFNMISKHNFSAVPVVDKEAGMRLVGNVSAKDIRLLLGEPDMLIRIYQPIYQFLASKNAEFDENIPEAMIVCHKEDTLKDVLLKLVSYRIHRIYVVDKSGTFQNIISLTDLLGVLVVEP